MSDFYSNADLEAQHFLGIEETSTYSKQFVLAIDYQDLLSGTQLGIDLLDVFAEDVAALLDELLYSRDYSNPKPWWFEYPQQRLSPRYRESEEAILGTIGCEETIVAENVAYPVRVRTASDEYGLREGFRGASTKLVVSNDSNSSQLVKPRLHQMEGHSKSDTYISILRAYF